jgi:hypothetical protein
MLISFFRMHDKTKILISPINNPQIITGDFHMIRRLALTVGCIALSAVAFSGKAQAQVAPAATQDINFNGTIGSVCLFTNAVDGALAQGNLTDEWVEGAGGIPGAGTAASAGTVTLRCTGGGQLATSVPVGTAPAGFTPSVLQSIVYDGTSYTSANTGGNFDTGLWNQSTTPLTVPVNTPVDLAVGMVAGTNATVNSVPAGTYSYTVTLTATPN